MTEPEIKKYLLGEMADEEQERFEARYFADDELFEQVAMAREEMIDAAVRGQLSEAEQRKFDATGGRSSTRREDVAFARSLRMALADANPSIRAPRPMAARWQWGLAAAALLLLGVCGWLLLQNRRLREQRDLFRRERDAAWQARQQAEEALAGRPVASPTPAPSTSPGGAPIARSDDQLITLNLSSEMRGPDDDNTARLAPRTTFVRLRCLLNFKPSPRDAFLTIRTAEGATLFPRQRARIEHRFESYSLIVDLPASRLKSGEYHVAGSAADALTGEAKAISAQFFIRP